MTEPTDNVYPELDKDDFYPGLTKREYFAGLAMQGLLACTQTIDGEQVIVSQHISECSVMMADALIEALNKETK
jgi:hypothetical protein